MTCAVRGSGGVPFLTRRKRLDNRCVMQGELGTSLGLSTAFPVLSQRNSEDTASGWQPVLNTGAPKGWGFDSSVFRHARADHTRISG